MKYINKFSTNADYQAFTGGGYVTPNICYVEETKSLVYKPNIAPVLITFYIGEVECFAEKGMTWGQWFNSEYYSPFYANGGWYITEDTFTTLAQVNNTDVIIENNNYILPNHGGGSD